MVSHPCSESHPVPASSLPSSFTSASSGSEPFPSLGLVSFPSVSLRIPSGSVYQDGPRAFSKHCCFLYSLSTRWLTPSVHSSSLSAPLDPQPRHFETFSASSWKVKSTLTLPPWGSLRSYPLPKTVRESWFMGAIARKRPGVNRVEANATGQSGVWWGCCWTGWALATTWWHWLQAPLKAWGLNL